MSKGIRHHWPSVWLSGTHRRHPSAVQIGNDFFEVSSKVNRCFTEVLYLILSMNERCRLFFSFRRRTWRLRLFTFVLFNIHGPWWRWCIFWRASVCLSVCLSILDLESSFLAGGYIFLTETLSSYKSSGQTQGHFSKKKPKRRWLACRCLSIKRHSCFSDNFVESW